MRVCIKTSTGELIEAQSLATEGTLIKNAVNAGYNINDIEEKVVSQEEFESLLKEPVLIKELTPEQKLEKAGLTLNELRGLLGLN